MFYRWIDRDDGKPSKWIQCKYWEFRSNATLKLALDMGKIEVLEQKHSDKAAMHRRRFILYGQTVSAINQVNRVTADLVKMFPELYGCKDAVTLMLTGAKLLRGEFAYARYQTKLAKSKKTT